MWYLYICLSGEETPDTDFQTGKTCGYGPEQKKISMFSHENMLQKQQNGGNNGREIMERFFISSCT